MRESTLRLSLPQDGITDGTVVLRFPAEDDIDGLLVAVADPELREAANMPGYTREGVVRSLPKPDGRRVDKTLFSLLPGE
jgi:hypothetical protein